MKRFLPLILILGVFAACNKAKEGGGVQIEKKPIKEHVQEAKKDAHNAAPEFETAVTVQGAYDATLQKIVAHVQVAEGYHAYAPGTELGVPVSLQVSNENGWALDGDIDIPNGEIKDLAVGVSNVIEGAFDITAKVKNGKGPIMAEARIQVCTEKVCDRPRNYKFSVTP